MNTVIAKRTSAGNQIDIIARTKFPHAEPIDVLSEIPGVPPVVAHAALLHGKIPGIYAIKIAERLGSAPVDLYSRLKRRRFFKKNWFRSRNSWHSPSLPVPVLWRFFLSAKNLLTYSL